MGFVTNSFPTEGCSEVNLGRITKEREGGGGCQPVENFSKMFMSFFLRESLMGVVRVKKNDFGSK